MWNVIAYADGVDDILHTLNEKVFNPVIELSFIVALGLFLWGVVEFIRGAASEEKRTKGRSHMLWGLIGFVIMFSVFGIINLLLNTFGIKGATINKDQQTFVAPTIQDVNIGK